MSHTPETATVTVVADTTTSTTILAENPSRKGYLIVNDSTAVLYLLFGSGTASSTNWSIVLLEDDAYEPFTQQGSRCYTGPIVGVWASDAGGQARVTEFT